VSNVLEILGEGKFIRLVRRNGWEWAERTNTAGGVIMLAVTDAKELVLVEQYRPPLGARVIELPAGLTGDEPDKVGEEPVEAACRELLEETGFESLLWEELLAGPSSAGLTTESYTLFLARGARRVAAGGGDSAEDITVHLAPLDDIDAWLADQRQQGAVVDPKIYGGLYFLTRM